MQRHPAELAYAWFDQAMRDLDTARSLVLAARFEAACFHAQQSAEKALKALLIWRRGDRPRTHEVERLVREVLDPTDDAAILDELAALDPYYVTTRYPDAVGGGVPGHKFFASDARIAVARAERGLAWIEAAMPPRPVP